MKEGLNTNIPLLKESEKAAFLRAEEERFKTHMEELSRVAQKRTLSLKVLKYLNLYKAGLPLDSTVRYFSETDIKAIFQRVRELSNMGFETWVSFATPEIPDPRVSIQRKTPLVKEVNSPEDYEMKVVPKLQLLPRGTWVKLFYDTHKDELKNAISGAIRITADDMPIDQREVVIGWGVTPDVRQIDRYIVWTTRDRTWRYMDKEDPKNPEVKLQVESPEELEIIRKIMGSRGEYRRKMALLAQKEGKRSICFEFKIRPGTELPFFFIDYEYAGEGGQNESFFNWFFYGHDGD